MPVNPKPAKRSGTLGARVIELDPVAVAAVHHSSPPRLVCDVPFNGFEQPGFKGLGGSVTGLQSSLHGIDGVAPVVPGTILHEGDEIVRVGTKRRGAFRK